MIFIITITIGKPIRAHEGSLREGAPTEWVEESAYKVTFFYS